ncbi:tyrosine-type recombinase/integrase [Brevibacillus laterosporus]|uniref:Tyrosine-type recombinase/integrase n=1 Tax=Brevibacillus laterosporus TaxID=1465 RepID=A0AAP3DMM6_BRELA|nr:tyrosine-type recombinase/integrase [Brevibacillus laterosporus]MCR8983214.1 tyrosine-type recombinase/integrase [Brevibacillus laterosporus]MCZ0810370.1 tyrosine-type recombinase/integrase [Brevibacillus laterosporus]MCZ0828258.1 tyrosine-type recombinase/integrase [Brevibacillus laterosporus]MCZ0853092.1 tyrosine-type recombinase/integrase [Brevibacillus laterosporus]
METVQPIRDREQIKTMKVLLGHRSKRDLLLFVLGINSGLRISDILDMKVCDVIDKRGRAAKHFDLRERKTRKRKRFPFSEQIRKVIEDYLKDYLKDYKGDINRPLFVSQKRAKDGTYRPITRQRAWIILNNVAKKIGITDNVGTHSLRKTFGYHAYQEGVSIEVLQRIFNHSDPRITLDYIGITQDAIDDVYRRLNL